MNTLWDCRRSIFENCSCSQICATCNQGCENPYAKAPMPWIGLYVAAASLICFLAIAADAYKAFRSRKLWFPCKFFTLNAASLTLLGVAMKMTLDLGSYMPGTADQLVKLSSTAFMCISIGNFMPSIGPMDDKDIFMNIIALGILVITVVGNVCIQLATGVIENYISAIKFSLLVEHIVVMFFMIALFIILTFSAFSVATTKKYLESKYVEIHKMASNEGEAEESEEHGPRLITTFEKLKVHVNKCWMMAETASPQFVMARSVTCSASGAICFLTVLVLVEAFIKKFYLSIQISTHPFDIWIHSDYKWSTFVILVIQTAAVVVGAIGPSFRWFNAIKFKCSKQIWIRSIYKTKLKPESYWIQRLVEWKESHLVLRIRDQKCRKLVQIAKDLLLNCCIKVQIVIVVASKLIVLISIFFVGPFFSSHRCCNTLWRKLVCKLGISKNQTVSETVSHIKPNPELYVLLLEGEDELPKKMLKNISNVGDRSIKKSKMQQPKNLKQLLQETLKDFKWVAEFDINQVARLHSQEPPNCWALPVVTLTSIAIAIFPKSKKGMVDFLVHSVSESLLYVSLIDKSMDGKGYLKTIRNAAQKVWLGVELHRKWLDEDLHKKALKEISARETLDTLARLAEDIVKDFKKSRNGVGEDYPPNLSVKVIAANSMYRITKTLLLQLDCEESATDITGEKLLEKLCQMIASILGACLTNLPGVITLKCFSSAIENRKKSVRQAARLLGETEEILKILEQHKVLRRRLTHDQVAGIDEWRAKFELEKSPLAFRSSFNNNTAGSVLADRSVVEIAELAS